MLYPIMMEGNDFDPQKDPAAVVEAEAALDAVAKDAGFGEVAWASLDINENLKRWLRSARVGG
ncbi:MAG: hypothetical protein AAF699_21680 [Pseudomonadota bacterium]